MAGQRTRESAVYAPPGGEINTIRRGGRVVTGQRTRKSAVYAPPEGKNNTIWRWRRAEAGQRERESAAHAPLSCDRTICVWKIFKIFDEKKR